MSRLKDDARARATLGLVIGMILCCALPILVFAGFGAALITALRRWDLWFGLVALILGVSILYVVVQRAINTRE